MFLTLENIHWIAFTPFPLPLDETVFIFDNTHMLDNTEAQKVPSNYFSTTFHLCYIINLLIFKGDFKCRLI